MAPTPERRARLEPDERRRLREVLERTTPAERIAWLEEAIAFAHRAGALPRRHPQTRPARREETR